MQSNITILVADDDDGHAGLITKNLKRGGIANEILRFKDGQEVLDFLENQTDKGMQAGQFYVLLLDIRMPKVNGIDVLRHIKQSSRLQTLPVIMVTTTDDPIEIETCYTLGCNSYLTKPVEYEEFVNAIRQLGLFLAVVQLPQAQVKK
jgi:CheY-like chemotaxis protein